MSMSAPGRRERNKQQKLDRITAAASELFADRGVDDVTTQEIAERADVGTGTLFLYARTKAELLLLVQNTRYQAALDRARAAVEAAETPIDAVMTIVQEVVECNRAHVGNGRTYLREVIFGDHDEPNRQKALELSASTEALIADALRRRAGTGAAEGARRARIVTAVMAFAMSADGTRPAGDILADIRTQVQLLIPHPA